MTFDRYSLKSVLRRLGVGKVYRFSRSVLPWIRYTSMRWVRSIRTRLGLPQPEGFAGNSVPPGVTPFIVLGTARSGSTLLMERLSSLWSEVRHGNEVFNVTNRRFRPFEELREMTYFRDSGHRIVGCKVLSGHVSEKELRTLLAIPDLRVVILRRENLIRQFVSSKIAWRDRVWAQGVHTERSDVASRVVNVSVDELLAFCERRSRSYELFERLTEGLPVLHVTYEDLAANLDQEMRRIGEFLGAGEPDGSQPPKLKRQNPEPLSELISNFGELHAALDNGGHSTLASYL